MSLTVANPASTISCKEVTRFQSIAKDLGQVSFFFNFDISKDSTNSRSIIGHSKLDLLANYCRAKEFARFVSEKVGSATSRKLQNDQIQLKAFIVTMRNIIAISVAEITFEQNFLPSGQEYDSASKSFLVEVHQPACPQALQYLHSALPKE